MPSSDEQMRRGGTLCLFLAAVLLYITYLASVQPHFLFGGEMWAEMATNYFPNASAPGLVHRLFATDAGYVPLPQRLLALFGTAIHLPASGIPYYYTLAALLLTGAMVASFCLAPFRGLVRSDGLRFMVVVAVLWVADFESRTFINFTYFSAFFVAVNVALAWTGREVEIPRMAWLIPVLVISKPAVLAAMPALVITAIVRGGRMRRIAIVSILLCAVQMAQMALSQTAGTFLPAVHYTLWQKAWTAVAYFFGYTAVLGLGWKSAVLRHHAVLIGVLLVVVTLVYAWRRRGRVNPLLPIGLSLVFFNMLLNAFALSDMWNVDMARLASPSIYRHVIIAYFGIILAVVGLLNGRLAGEKGAGGRWTMPGLSHVALVLFLFWFAGAGWFSYARRVNQSPDFPAFGNSQWQRMAYAIDTAPSVCVPIDPVGWFYGRNCRVLGAGISPAGLQFQPVLQDGAPRDVPLPLFDGHAGAQVVWSLAVPVQSLEPGRRIIEVYAVVGLRDGQSRTLRGQFQSGEHGAGLVQLSSAAPLPADQIIQATLHADEPLAVGYLPRDGKLAPAVMWMGQ